MLSELPYALYHMIPTTLTPNQTDGRSFHNMATWQSILLLEIIHFISTNQLTTTMMSNDDSIQIVPQMEAPADDDSFNRDVCEVTNANDNANDTADDIDTTQAARQVLDQATARQTVLDGPLSSSSSSEQHNLQTAVQLGSMTADVANCADELSAVMDEYDVGSISGVETQIQMLDREKLWGPSIVGSSSSRPTSTSGASFRSNSTGPSKDDTGVGGRLHSSKSSQGGSGRLHTSTSQGSFSKMRNFLTGSFSALGMSGDDGARSQRSSSRHQMDPPATQLTESDYPNMMQDEDDDDDEYSSAASSAACSHRNGGGELSASYDDAGYDLHAEQLAKLSASSRSSTRGRRGGRMWRGDSANDGTDRTARRGTKQMSRRTSYNSAYTNAYTASSYATGGATDDAHANTGRKQQHDVDEHDIESGGDGSLLERVNRATSNRTNTSQRSAANSSSRYAASSQQQQRGAPGVSLAAAAALASEYSHSFLQSTRSTLSTVTGSVTSDVNTSMRKNGTNNSKVLDWTDAMATTTKIPGQKARRRREMERMCRRRWFVPVILIILILLALLVHYAKLRIRDRHNHGDDISLSDGGGRGGADSGVTGNEGTDGSIIGGEGVFNLSGGDVIEAFESPTISPAPTPTEQGKNANAITHTIPGVDADTGDREYGSETGTEFTFGSDVTFGDDKGGAEGLVDSDASKVDLTWQFDRPTNDEDDGDNDVKKSSITIDGETKETSTVVEEITTSSLVLSSAEDGSETSKKLSASLQFHPSGEPVVDDEGRPLDAEGNVITIDDEPVVLQMDENSKPIIDEEGHALMVGEDGESSTPIVTETKAVTKTRDETLHEMFDTQGARPVEVAELDYNVGGEEEKEKEKEDPVRPVEIFEEAPSTTEPIVQTKPVQEPVVVTQQTAAEAPIPSPPSPPQETIIKHVYEPAPTPVVPPPAPANYDLGQIFNLMSTLMTATTSNQQQPVAVAAVPVQPTSTAAGSAPAQPSIVRPGWGPAVVGGGYGGFGYGRPGPVAVEPYGVLHNVEYLESCRAEYGDNKCFYNDDDSLKLARSKEDYAISEIYYSNPIKCCGIVVEIGAGNGKKDSVGHFFEYGMNWRAINIEADPALYQELAVNRPDAENHFGGFCESDHMLHDKKGFHALNDGEVVSEKLSATTSLDTEKASKVPCLSLEKDVFKPNQITHVDVMVVQGSGEALAVIRKMMWNVRVDIWIILNDESSEGRSGTSHDKTVSVVLERNEYVKAEWDIARWCGDEPGSCRRQMVYLRKGFNPLPGNVQSSLKRYLRKQSTP